MIAMPFHCLEIKNKKQSIFIMFYLVLVFATSAAFAWNPKILPPPVQTLGVVEHNVINWLSTKSRPKETEKALFVRLAFYAEPRQANKLLEGNCPANPIYCRAAYCAIWAAD